MYVTIPSANSTGLQFGSEVVQSAELEIGGQRIDYHTKEWNNLWNELTLSTHNALGLRSMLSEGKIIKQDQPLTYDPNVGGFGQAETEIVLQNPSRIVGYMVLLICVTLCQLFLVLKKKQFEKVQAAEMNF